MTTPPTHHGGGVQLRAVPMRAGIDSRRGLVRLAPSVLAALGARPYAVLRLTGTRTTCALVALSDSGQDPASVLVDDLTLGNLAIAPGTPVAVEVVPSLAADRIVLAGPPQVTSMLNPQTARLMLLGKSVMPGDSVSLLQQDYALPDGANAGLLDGGRQQVQSLFGTAWQGFLFTVVTAPEVPTIVTMTTAVTWQVATEAASNGAVASGFAVPGQTTFVPASDPSTVPLATVYPPQPPAARPVIGWSPNSPTLGRSARSAPSAPLAPSATSPTPRTSGLPTSDLPGAEAQARELRELLDVGLNHPALLTQLGTRPSLGVLLTGPAGSGKISLLRQVASSLGLTVTKVWCPDLAALTPDAGLKQLAELKKAALGDAGAHGVLALDDVEALAPSTGDASLRPAMVDLIREIVAAGRCVVALSAAPDVIDRQLRAPNLLSRQLALTLPDEKSRRALCAHLTQPLPLAADVSLDDLATRTPGFVAADLAAVITYAGQHAAERERATPSATPQVTSGDFAAALACVHPSSMDGQLLDPGQISLADIGGLAEVKAVLTESVLWPITYPDTFARLGVAPTRGVLLYGPPGCGKTYIVKALAHDGRANVLSVKGAELLSKWVGESEAGVRQLFARARGAAPSLIFLDEVDALAPVRGSGSDDVADRVVAALLTEMDGIDQLHGVVVVAATNRPDMVDPALLRPGRLERLLYLPPPDAAARADIMKSAAAHTPLGADVDLAALAAQCDGFSGADCAALIRAAAIAAMRRSMDAPSVTAADVASALTVVRPSLNRVEVEKLRDYAAARAGA